MSTDRHGTVVAVCRRPDGGVPKNPEPEVIVGRFGLVGDYHAGKTRLNRKAGEVETNLRQISVVAKEVFDDLARELGAEIPPGGFGENVLVEGLGDLSGLKAGDVMQFSSGVEFEVTGQNDPCKNLMCWHPQVPKRAYGRRGIVGVVRRPGVLRPGDTVTLREASRRR
ncbi:MAG: MOSC domain-containing protein [Chloroflexi bacterium]|nr:MOSC domain-containing protein [Chloroflexota bacterium]